MVTHFTHPFSLILAGPSGAGKSSFATALIENLDICVQPRILKIIWCYAEISSIPKRLKSRLNVPIQFHEGVPEKFENPLNIPTLIVLDDLMLESDNKRVCELFTRGSHHRSLSVVLLTQNFFVKGNRCRDISLNAKYIVIFKNPRDKAQFQYLARQIYPENPRELVRVYNEQTARPFTYILFDLTQDTHPLLRYRTNIFDKDGCVVFCEKPTISSENVQIETFDGIPTYALRT